MMHFAHTFIQHIGFRGTVHINLPRTKYKTVPLCGHESVYGAATGTVTDDAALVTCPQCVALLAKRVDHRLQSGAAWIPHASGKELDRIATTFGVCRSVGETDQQFSARIIGQFVHKTNP